MNKGSGLIRWSRNQGRKEKQQGGGLPRPIHTNLREKRDSNPLAVR